MHVYFLKVCPDYWLAIGLDVHTQLGLQIVKYFHKIIVMLLLKVEMKYFLSQEAVNLSYP